VSKIIEIPKPVGKPTALPIILGNIKTFSLVLVSEKNKLVKNEKEQTFLI
jgi:hypothetical protein